jgi:hypothetical protein
LSQSRARQTSRRRMNELQFRDDRISGAGDFLQPVLRSIDDLGKGAESGDQPLGEILGVPPLNGAEKD